MPPPVCLMTPLVTFLCPLCLLYDIQPFYHLIEFRAILLISYSLMISVESLLAELHVYSLFDREDMVE